MITLPLKKRKNKKKNPVDMDNCPKYCKVY